MISDIILFLADLNGVKDDPNQWAFVIEIPLHGPTFNNQIFTIFWPFLRTNEKSTKSWKFPIWEQETFKQEENSLEIQLLFGPLERR